MKRVITCPAGRKKHMEVLMLNLLKNREEYDSIELWLNTDIDEDVQYLEDIERKYDFVKLLRLDIKPDWIWTIGSFFPQSLDEDKIYLRFDDDICYIHKGSIKNMFDERMKDQSSLLLYGNIVNNAITSHLHTRYGILKSDLKFGYDCVDEIGWKNGQAVLEVHNNFFNKYKLNKLDEYYMPNWDLLFYERFSANVISWRGKDFKEFDGISYGHEEIYLSEIKPKELNKTNKIVGNTLFCHYSFHTQAEFVNSTNIYDTYKSIALS